MLMCIVLSTLVVALCEAISIVCLHDVSLMHMHAESTCGAGERVLG
jgi:hypothetical protein